tara:strand:+ start:6400 stop:6588 length:189 start_codon:yes stop_codon:yes gene_type:complete
LDNNIKIVKDTFETAFVNGGLLAISISDVEGWLRLASIILAIGYTADKWYLDYKKRKGNSKK